MPDPNIAAWTRLDPKVRTLWRIEAAIGALISLVFTVGAGFIVDEILADEHLRLTVHPALLGLLLGLALVALSFYVASRKYDFWRYDVGEDDLAVAHGIWWRTRTYVPRARIQHVDVTAGPIARALGLAVVSVFVSGHPGAVATIPGLRSEVADKLRGVLLRLSEQGPPPVVSGG
jgi:membrane protein YdbS with pleckstrin-like domain